MEFSHDRGSFEEETILSQRYKVVRLLGRGGSGFVLLVEDLQLGGELVVLKLLNSNLVQSLESTQRLRNESNLALELSHPNIVQTYSFEHADDGTYFITMEYLSGGSLLDEITNSGQGLELELVQDYINQIVHGLGFAHSRGVVHRDIKPHNLLLDQEGTLKIADFGVSRMLWGDMAVTRAGDLVGTPQYMSPEQLESKAVDVRSDIYSLGMTFYELVTAKPAFVADTLYELAMCHISEPLPSLAESRPDVPSWYQEFFATCCAKDRNVRFQSMLAVSSFLKARMKSSWISLDIDTSIIAKKEEKPKAELKKRFQRELTTFVVVFALIISIGSCVYAGRANIPVNRRIATAVLKLENKYNLRLSAIRSLFVIDVEFGDRQAFFITEFSRSKVFPLLHAGMDPNFYLEINNERVTPLHFWSKYSSKTTFRTIRELVKYGADVNLVAQGGRTPLHVAIRYGGVPQSLYFLDQEVDLKKVDQYERGYLHYSVLYAKPLVRKRLLEEGVRVNRRDKRGNTALHYAVSLADLGSVKDLLNSGADPRLINLKGLAPIDVLGTREEKSSLDEQIYSLLKAASSRK